jgi:hypothetical protein
MKLETVGGISVGDVGFEVGWQIDDRDCRKRTFLRADAATNTETFGDEGDLGGRFNFDTKASTTHNGAGFLAFLSA